MKILHTHCTNQRLYPLIATLVATLAFTACTTSPSIIAGAHGPASSENGNADAAIGENTQTTPGAALTDDANALRLQGGREVIDLLADVTTNVALSDVDNLFPLFGLTPGGQNTYPTNTLLFPKEMIANVKGNSGGNNARFIGLTVTLITSGPEKGSAVLSGVFHPSICVSAGDVREKFGKLADETKFESISTDGTPRKEADVDGLKYAPLRMKGNRPGFVAFLFHNQHCAEYFNLRTINKTNTKEIK